MGRLSRKPLGKANFGGKEKVMIRFEVEARRAMSFCPLNSCSTFSFIQLETRYAKCTFCGRGPPLPKPKSVRSKTAILIRLFFPPFLSGAFYTGGSSDLFITVISLLSWRRNRIPWIRKREDDLTDRQTNFETWIVRLKCCEGTTPSFDCSIRHPPCLERSREWGESRLDKNRREAREDIHAHEQHKKLCYHI